MSKTRKRPAGLHLERLGCDQLERRVVLDGGSLAPPSETLIVDSPFTMPTPTAMAQFGDFTYEVANGAVTITGYTGGGGEVVIPEKIEGLPVTTIGARAFMGARLVTLVIPGNVATVGDQAFQDCEQLTSVTVSPGVQSIGNQSFYRCRSLATLALGDSVQSIGNSAFSGCFAISELTIPDSVVAIGEYAFTSCIGLQSVMIGEGLRGFSTGLFAYCSGLKTLVIPESVERIGEYAFRECTDLLSVSIPDNVTHMGRWAFVGCSKLSSVQLGAGLTSLSDFVFSKCASLTQVAIPSGVIAIGREAFSGCIGLRDVTLTTGFKSIGALAFSGCSSLADIHLPESLTTLDDAAFRYSGLKSIRIPAGVTRIAPWLFDGCMQLSNVEVPSTVTAIDAYAFRGCTNLASIRIPFKVIRLGQGTFQGCVSLAAVTFEGAPPQVDFFYPGDIFENAPATVLYYSDQPGWGASFAGRPTAAIGLVALTVSAGDSAVAAIPGNATSVAKRGLGTLILDSANNLPDGIFIQEGTLVVRHRDALGGGVLTVAAGAHVVIETGSSALRLSGLSITAGGRLNINTGRITVAAGGFTEAGVRQSLLSGFNGGLWNGTSGIMSGAATYGSNRAVGYRITGSGLEVAWAAIGDADLDGQLTAFDLVGLQSGGKFNKDQPATWQDGDVNYDGRFNILDLVATNATGLFGRGSYLPPPSQVIAAIDPFTVFSILAAESDED